MVIEARARVTVTASRHPRFSGLGEADVEELFDATSEVVLSRHLTYESEEHVRRSLWRGMEMRALDVFRRRGRRGVELDPQLLELVPDDLGQDEERISDAQELLVVRDFLAALAPREAEVWKLVHGEELSVVQTAKRLGISRHAIGEHLEAAGRKLEVFVAIRQAGEWCGRRETDILRLLDGADDEGTLRRSLAHLQACGVCRRAYAAQVRQTGRLAAGVLPMPAVLDTDHGRSIVERIADLLPFGGSGSGRTEAIGSALLGGGGGLAGVAKVGAVVATTATVAVGGTVVVDRAGPERSDERPVAVAPSTGAAAAPAPVAEVVRVSPAVVQATARKTAAAAKRNTASAKTQQRKALSRQQAAERREEVFELGTVESAGPSGGAAASSSGGSSSGGAAPVAPDPPGQESFLP